MAEIDVLVDLMKRVINKVFGEGSDNYCLLNIRRHKQWRL